MMSLTAHSVSYAYPHRRGVPAEPALRDVSLTVAPGAFVGLLGPNGCGKTTLLKLLSGVVSPDSGRVDIAGQPLASMSRRDAARRIAVVPQETHPAFEFTVMEMVLMGRHPHLGVFQLEGPDDFAVVRDALEATGTTHLAARRFSELSGGERQRVVIASALAQSAGVLLLDEPTASLDLRYQLDVASLLVRLNRQRGVTMVLATHDLNLAASVCDSLILLREGRVLSQGPAADILTPAMVSALYDVGADVRFHDRAGHLTVVPLARR
jgi:iron complex transport system ATP-binding protein